MTAVTTRSVPRSAAPRPGAWDDWNHQLRPARGPCPWETRPPEGWHGVCCRDARHPERHKGETPIGIKNLKLGGPLNNPLRNDIHQVTTGMEAFGSVLNSAGAAFKSTYTPTPLAKLGIDPF